MKLILIRAFKESTDKCLGQPDKRLIEKAAYDYLKISNKVHKKIGELVPLTNVVRRFKTGRIRHDFEAILAEFVGYTGYYGSGGLAGNENDEMKVLDVSIAQDDIDGK